MQTTQMTRIGWALALAVGLAWAAGAGFQLVTKQAKSFATTGDFPAASSGLTVDRAANRISIATAGEVHLTALAGPKSKMLSFEIDGLTNPEIRVPAGTRLTLSVANVDDDMLHDLYITAQAPPYPRQISGGTIGTAVLRSYKGKSYAGAVLVVQARQPGTSYYVCTISGHARGGMYGKLVVTQ